MWQPVAWKVSLCLWFFPESRQTEMYYYLYNMSFQVADEITIPTSQIFKELSALKG